MDNAPQPEKLKSPAELALELYNVLLPYPSDVRQRAIQAAMTTLGEGALSPRQGIGQGGSVEGAGDLTDLKLGAKALKWAITVQSARVMW